ncbi:hypothetical protein GcC1_124008 [Golovinomyces cichoracearum]|uniref:UDENN FLCN/SMCR8-type domain-containing protein n=1 Tax=Golovinomyces cichoracearum TaxID=62708 RepID=A0A420I6B1_9PEZI|nr:hypothetical protein GcC1_124008 [Golovinomyces cichoracearum]
MVTEGIPVGCNSCFQDDAKYMRRPILGLPSLNPADGLASISQSLTMDKSIASSSNIESPRKQPPKNAMATPPESPKIPTKQGSSVMKGDFSFRRTYNEVDKKRASPCDNCALTLPKQKDMTRSPTCLENDSPILRTRKPYERITASAPADQLSPPDSEYSGEKYAMSDQISGQKVRFSGFKTSGMPSNSFPFSSTTSSHEHYLDYTSTHEPILPKSFSIVRHSCLRTLSCESLPPSSIQPISSPKFSHMNTFFSTSSPTSTGGPIFFGDPLTGYTTAYTFRIPDPNVRGCHRVYALMALTTKRERIAMQSFSYLSAVFRELAQWILTMAELELEKAGGLHGANHGDYLSSSFLIGLRGPETCGKLVFKNRGLAEIVGMPDFFIELHSRFVRLLSELRVLLR